MTSEDLDALPLGSVVALATADETVNVGRKTGAAEWGLIGKADRFTTEQLFRLAVVRDGFTLTVIYQP